MEHADEVRSENLGTNQENIGKTFKIVQNSSLVGSVATTTEGKKGSTLYIIGDYLYFNGIPRSGNKLAVKCRNQKLGCRGRAILKSETLQVLRFKGEHTCIGDPHLRFQIQMESEMKELAETTTDSCRGIFNRVCRSNPAIAPRISFSRMYKAMNQRRNQMKRVANAALVY